MGHQVPYASAWEVHPQVPTHVLPVDGETGFQLDLECGRTVEVVG